MENSSELPGALQKEEKIEQEKFSPEQQQVMDEIHKMAKEHKAMYGLFVTTNLDRLKKVFPGKSQNEILLMVTKIGLKKLSEEN